MIAITAITAMHISRITHQVSAFASHDAYTSRAKVCVAGVRRSGSFAETLSERVPVSPDSGVPSSLLRLTSNSSHVGSTEPSASETLSTKSSPSASVKASSGIEYV